MLKIHLKLLNVYNELQCTYIVHYKHYLLK